ncbi:hypothetical protein ACGF0D_36545 [Kitasatospora sp. NPDC048298]|uniref:hypothetical protein n=1 Tax=Kitasatospora sp. NPDC048298 TaxID=3364049 RepID=UPI003717E99F
MSGDHTPSDPTGEDDQNRNGPRLDPRSVLELAEFLGMDEETEQLRGDLRTERILSRLKRALDLAGLPISTGPGAPGVRVLPGWDNDIYPAGSVRVAWNEGADLDAMIETAKPDSPADILCQAVTSAMDRALDTILQAAGLRTIVDSLDGFVVVADTMTIPGAEELGL